MTDVGDGPDTEWFERLYAATYPAVAGYVLRRTSDPADAADVVAETYLTLWRRLGELPHDADARLWLYGVARRVLANQRRSSHRWASLSARLAEDLTLATRPDSVAEASADRHRIANAFRNLSDGDRELLALVGWEGLDRDQIATTLGVNRAVVRVRLHRARQRFARELETTDREPARAAKRDDPSPRPSITLDQEEALS